MNFSNLTCDRAGARRDAQAGCTVAIYFHVRSDTAQLRINHCLNHSEVGVPVTRKLIVFRLTEVPATTLKAINRELHALDPATELLRMDWFVYFGTNQNKS